MKDIPSVSEDEVKNNLDAISQKLTAAIAYCCLAVFTIIVASFLLTCYREHKNNTLPNIDPNQIAEEITVIDMGIDDSRTIWLDPLDIFSLFSKMSATNQYHYELGLRPDGTAIWRTVKEK